MRARRFVVAVALTAACARSTPSGAGARDGGVAHPPAPVASSTLPVLEDADLVFQTSRSPQSQAIQLATHSKFSHVGIVYRTREATIVFEAIGPVTSTPLAAWIERGDGGHYTVKRLADRSRLDDATLTHMRTVGKRYAGKPYDFAFGWSDDKLYCSELVWKIFHEGAGIDLAPLAKLRDFDLTSPVVKQKLSERYGSDVPLDETVVSPSALAESPLLVTVMEK